MCRGNVSSSASSRYRRARGTRIHHREPPSLRPEGTGSGWSKPSAAGATSSPIRSLGPELGTEIGEPVTPIFQRRDPDPANAARLSPVAAGRLRGERAGHHRADRVQARRAGRLCGAAPQVVCGAHLLVDQPLSSYRQRLRAPARTPRRDRLLVHDHHHGTPSGPPPNRQTSHSTTRPRSLNRSFTSSNVLECFGALWHTDFGLY